MYFYDNENDRYISLEEVKALFNEFKAEDPLSYDGVTFAQYLNNCMYYNNGCLEDLQTRKWCLLRQIETLRFTWEDEAEEEVIPLLQEVKLIESL